MHKKFFIQNCTEMSFFLVNKFRLCYIGLTINISLLIYSITFLRLSQEKPFRKKDFTLKTRVISASVLIVLVVGCFFISPITKALLLMLIGILAAREMCNAIAHTGAKCVPAILYVCVIAATAAIYFKADPLIISLIFFLAVFSILTAGIVSREISGKGALGTLAVLVYPIVPLLMITEIAISPDWVPVFALGCISTWVCDAFALFGGKWFGKHKFAPDVSPNKTIEGCISGAVCSVIAGIILYFALRNSYNLSLVCCMVTALICSSFGQIGDLAASLIKRMSGIKDYSNLIPGHGGAMDRIDSLLFSIPTAYFCIILFTM